MKTSFHALFVLFLALTGSPCWSQTAGEAAARAAEKSGRLRDALTQYTAALNQAAEGGGEEQRLREAIVALAQRISPAPAIPDEARRFLVRGGVAIKEAKSAADFEEAAKEFGRAARVAPWWADAYFNQGVAYKKAGKFADAVRNMKLYLSSAPNAADAAKVREQIYAIEYRQEKAQKDAAAAAQEQQRRRAEEEARARDPARLAGEWCYEDQRGSRYCGWELRVSGDTIEMWARYSDVAGQRYRACIAAGSTASQSQVRTC